MVLVVQPPCPALERDDGGIELVLGRKWPNALETQMDIVNPLHMSRFPFLRFDTPFLRKYAVILQAPDS